MSIYGSILTERVYIEIPKDIQDFYKELLSYKYGVVKDGKVITDLRSFDFFQEYRSLTIEEIKKYKVGVCWDLVHYEADWFYNHGYHYETYFIEVNDIDGDLPTHSFLLFALKGSNKVYYFERSWGQYKGIEEFSSKNELLKTIMKRHIDACEQKVNRGSEVIAKYDAKSKSLEHITCVEYYKKASGGKSNLQEGCIYEHIWNID